MFSPVFTQQRTVGTDDLDELQHVNNLQYLRWSLKAAVAHSSHVGWPPERYQQLGAGWIVRSHNITYKVPALLNDEIIIRTWIADAERVSSRRKYEIIRAVDNRVCATAETQWVFVDFTTFKLVPIPEDIRMAFAGNRS